MCFVRTTSLNNHRLAIGIMRTIPLVQVLEALWRSQKAHATGNSCWQVTASVLEESSSISRISHYSHDYMHVIFKERWKLSEGKLLVLCVCLTRGK